MDNKVFLLITVAAISWLHVVTADCDIVSAGSCITQSIQSGNTDCGPILACMNDNGCNTGDLGNVLPAECSGSNGSHRLQSSCLLMGSLLALFAVSVVKYII